MPLTPYLSDPDVTLYNGDALACLRELPDESVHAVATSPPFFGLRDYGTGTWEGGDSECDHVAQERPPVVDSSSTLGYPADGGPRRIADENTYHEAYKQQYRAECGKCGARRIDQQIGLEETPEAWAAALVAVFREARRVLRKDGSMFVECGDSYNAGISGRPNRTIQHETDHGGWETLHSLRLDVAGLKPKDLIGQPFLLAFALRVDGWYWRGCYPWSKPNAMPESAKDRCTTAHSYVLHFAKSSRYFFDGDAIAEPAAWDRGDQTVPKHEGTETAAGWIPPRPRAELRYGRVGAYQNRAMNGEGDGTTPRRVLGPDEVPPKHPRSVWTIPTRGFSGAHFATWPVALAERIILAAVPRWVCSECGKARERIVEARIEHSQKTHNVAGPTEGIGHHRGAKFAASGAVAGTRITETVGFTDCNHNAYVPGTVLDPFAGACTTLVVAKRLGRHGIGIELNPDYCAMGAERLASWWRDPPQPKRNDDEAQQSLLTTEHAG